MCVYMRTVHNYLRMQIATLQVLIRLYNETSNTLKGTTNSILNGINIGIGLLLRESKSLLFLQWHNPITFYVYHVYLLIHPINYVFASAQEISHQKKNMYILFFFKTNNHERLMFYYYRLIQFVVDFKIVFYYKILLTYWYNNNWINIFSSRKYYK